MTDAEQKIWSRLRGEQIGYYFRRQVPIGKYIVDFFCRKEKLIIEIDGSQHLSRTGKEHDSVRDRFLQAQGFRILRFNNVDALENTDGVLQEIFKNLVNPLSSP